MITRDQFEAHVRVEAERKHELSPERTTYIAARMEHEWPLVEALDQCRAVLNLHTSIVTRRPTEREYEDALGVAYDALSPYTTKPIEP